MKAVSKGIDLRTVGVAVAGGGAVIFMAAQLLAKPNLPRTIRMTSRDAGAQAAPASAPTRSPLVAEPPVRELFVPLVRKPAASGSKTLGLPAGSAPALPLAGRAASTPAPAAAPRLPAASGAPATSAPAAPSGPRADDIQMLGIVELDGQPQVLLKRTSTGESRYYAKGDDAYGFTVGEIKEDSVALSHQGKTETVVMSRAISVEGPGAATTASNSGFSGGDGFGGFGGRDRSRRRDRGGDSSGGGSSSTVSTAQLFSLPTWTERLKKLEEIKSQLEPAQYERLKTFMSSRAAQEKK